MAVDQQQRPEAQRTWFIPNGYSFIISKIANTSQFRSHSGVTPAFPKNERSSICGSAIRDRAKILRSPATGQQG
jgi:hypothetical protein